MEAVSYEAELNKADHAMDFKQTAQRKIEELKRKITRRRCGKLGHWGREYGTRDAVARLVRGFACLVTATPNRWCSRRAALPRPDW